MALRFPTAIIFAAFALGIAGLESPTLFADYTLYTIPGTDASMMVAGTASYNPGGTVTHRHPRGTLYFNARDIRVVKSPAPEAIYTRKLRNVTQANNVDEMLDLAKWALRNGMLEECKSLLGAAWKVDATHPKLKKLAGLMFYINNPVAKSESAERHIREYVGGRDMTLTPSKHFILLHSGDKTKDPITNKTRAAMRIELLETVYETYFLTFAFEGLFLRPPTEPMEVVLFGQHADFLQLESKIGGFVRQAAGFYMPTENIAIFYDVGTSSAFRALNSLTKQLGQVKDEIKRNRIAGGGEVIRLANTLELLIDITREGEDVATVSHEAVHQLAANTGLFPRDMAFVRWVHEGLASYFESSKNGTWRGVGVVDSDRIDYYRVLEGDPERGSLEFIVSDLGFLVEAQLGDQLPAYGQAWALTHFLINNHFDELIKFYKMIVDMPKDQSIKDNHDFLLKSFDTAFGDRAAIELEWRRYMRTLRTDLERLVEEGKI